MPTPPTPPRKPGEGIPGVSLPPLTPPIEPPVITGKVKLTQNKVDVPVVLPDGTQIVKTVTDPRLNAIMKVANTIWQLAGGLICGILAKKLNIVTSPEEVATTVVSVTAALSVVKNTFFAIKARKVAV